MKSVKLSTGEEVLFREKFTHADEMVFSAGRRKGVVERRYLREDGQTITETTPENYDAAFEDTLLVLIDIVKAADGDRKPSREWLGGLSEPDYDKLASMMADIRKESRQVIEAGKKNG